MAITIVGAGMAGLLAARMLANHKPRVVEGQEGLPNNHSAVLRFRTRAVGDIVGIPFKQVTMVKGYLPWQNPIADTLAYAKKTVGTYRSDRSITSTSLESFLRYIAPEDFINSLSEGVNISFRHFHQFKSNNSEPVISTIPMPQLMRMLGYKDVENKDTEFGEVHGFNLIGSLHEADAYVSLYVPNPEYAFNRISITGNRFIAEYSCPGKRFTDIPDLMNNFVVLNETKRAASLLGIEPPFASFPVFKIQRYAKIQPIDDDARKHFIAWATDKFNIYSLGRFATWRPGLLLDDLIKDIRLIERWLTSKNKYEVKAHR